MEYQCQRCGYKFESSRRPYACPYCGEIGTAKPTPTAHELIEEVTPKEKKKEERKELEKERF